MKGKQWKLNRAELWIKTLRDEGKTVSEISAITGYKELYVKTRLGRIELRDELDKTFRLKENSIFGINDKTYIVPHMKECPFCGGTPEIKLIPEDGNLYAFVQCQTCFSKTGRPFAAMREKQEVGIEFLSDAIALWQTRKGEADA